MGTGQPLRNNEAAWSQISPTALESEERRVLKLGADIAQNLTVRATSPLKVKLEELQHEKNELSQKERKAADEKAKMEGEMKRTEKACQNKLDQIKAEAERTVLGLEQQIRDLSRRHKEAMASRTSQEAQQMKMANDTLAAVRSEAQKALEKAKRDAHAAARTAAADVKAAEAKRVAEGEAAAKEHAKAQRDFEAKLAEVRAVSASGAAAAAAEAEARLKSGAGQAAAKLAEVMEAARVTAEEAEARLVAEAKAAAEKLEDAMEASRIAAEEAEARRVAEEKAAAGKLREVMEAAKVAAMEAEARLKAGSGELGAKLAEAEEAARVAAAAADAKLKAEQEAAAAKLMEVTREFEARMKAGSGEVGAKLAVVEEAARVAAAESAAKIETLEAAAAAKEIEMAKLERRLNEVEKAARATMKANATGMPWPAVNASAATIQAHARGNHARLVELPHAMRVKSFVLQAVLRISGDTMRTNFVAWREQAKVQILKRGEVKPKNYGKSARLRRAKQEQLRKSMMLDEAPVLS